MTAEYDGLRIFLADCERLGELKTITDADWDKEIGALTDSTAELIPEPPALLFDKFKGYPVGFRMLSLAVVSRVRTALALRLPTETNKMELGRLASRKLEDPPRIPPVVTSSGPVMQNVMNDSDVDLYKFPALKSHRRNGEGYIGTGEPQPVIPIKAV